MHAKPEILFVEDEPQQREMLQLMLEGEGYAVRSAESAEEALTLLQGSAPNLLITDVKLPGMDGFALFDKVKHTAKLSQVPILFITAYNDAKSIEHAREYGAAGYVTKPYNLEDLLDLVRKILPPG